MRQAAVKVDRAGPPRSKLAKAKKRAPPTKTISFASMASTPFKPIPPDVLKQLEPPTNEQWLGHLVTIRVAWAVLGKTKDELQELVIGEAGGITMDALSASVAFMKAVVEVLTAAELRVLCAGAAAVVAGRAK